MSLKKEKYFLVNSVIQTGGLYFSKQNKTNKQTTCNELTKTTTLCREISIKKFFLRVKTFRKIKIYLTCIDPASFFFKISPWKTSPR